MIHVNHGTASQAHAPFGGVKDSGQGADRIGPTARDFFTKVKAIYVRREAGGSAAGTVARAPSRRACSLARAYARCGAASSAAGSNRASSFFPTRSPSSSTSALLECEAPDRPETDGLIGKLPYKGWFVKDSPSRGCGTSTKWGGVERFGVRPAGHESRTAA